MKVISMNGKFKVNNVEEVEVKGKEVLGNMFSERWEDKLFVD